MQRMTETAAIRCGFAAALLAVAGPALGAHPLVTEDSGTQGQGKYQVEAQFEYARDVEAGIGERSRTSVLALSYGAHERVDVILTLPHERVKTTEDGETVVVRGGGDVSADVKWRFYDGQPFSMAIKTGFTFPTGDDDNGVGSGNVNASALLIGSAEFDPFALHVMTGFIGNQNDVGDKSIVRHVSIGASAAVGEFTLVADLGRYTTVDRRYDKYSAFGILGGIWSLNDDVDLDLGVKWGLTDAETDRALLAGAAWRF